ncbi:hypothetical protein [Streptomyces sp. L2]|uniref:hypothetical protein n=1 Tax=Streptomyces sp. L2 TaxID=2162665 RepID=UPI001010AD09|nr:hypothetical protein [Streptomyces sp. L2]
MGDTTPHPHLTPYPHIVVHPPARDGSRRVTEGGVTLGLASHLDDVVDLLRGVGLDRVEVEESDLIDWRGGGADDWPDLTDLPNPSDRPAPPDHRPQGP